MGNPVARAESNDVLPACDVACNHMYECLATNQLAVFHYCMATCDAKREAELRALAAAACDDLTAARLAAAHAPIKQRSCAQLVKTRTGHVPMGRREAIAAHAWCAVGKGTLPAGPIQYEADARLWGALDGCWTIDSERLWWTKDGVKWHSVALTWPMDDGVIRVGAQKLTVCRSRVEPTPSKWDPPRDQDRR